MTMPKVLVVQLDVLTTYCTSEPYPLIYFNVIASAIHELSPHILYPVQALRCTVGAVRRLLLEVEQLRVKEHAFGHEAAENFTCALLRYPLKT